MDELTLFQEDSLASHLALPGSDEARKMTVTSGRKCLELYRKSSPLGLLVRMLLESSEWYSTKCYLSWKVSDMKCNRLLFRLVPRTHRTEEIESGLLPTAVAKPSQRKLTDGKSIAANGQKYGMSIAQKIASLLPTPKAIDGIVRHSQKMARKKMETGGDVDLSIAVMLLPTPQATDASAGQVIAETDEYYRTASGSIRKVTQHGVDGTAGLARTMMLLGTPKAQDSRAATFDRGKGNMGEQVNQYLNGNKTGLRLQPRFVEWMMGFPDHWTELKDSKHSATR